VILLSAQANDWGLHRETFTAQLAADSRFEQIEPGPLLEVWRVRSP
jgi:hypothetical protein